MRLTSPDNYSNLLGIFSIIILTTCKEIFESYSVTIQVSRLQHLEGSRGGWLRKESNAFLSFLILQNQAKSEKQFYITDYAYNTKKLYLIPARRVTFLHSSLLIAPLVKN